MVTYEKLWETMEKKGMSQYCLIKKYHISGGQISRLKKNMYVSVRTLEKLCEILECRLEEVAEVIPDKKA